jgi:hypothetical protein
MQIKLMNITINTIAIHKKLSILYINLYDQYKNLVTRDRN